MPIQSKDEHLQIAKDVWPELDWVKSATGSVAIQTFACPLCVWALYNFIDKKWCVSVSDGEVEVYHEDLDVSLDTARRESIGYYRSILALCGDS